jgi:lipopolysaccharide export LptBFGC system permease protein LptF
MAVMIIFTLTLIGPFMRQFWSHPRAADLAVYLIPQALPLSIPMGLTFGILWVLGRLPASRTALLLVMVLALGSSVVSFVTLAWVMPNANQAFRTGVAEGPVVKGGNELTIGELRERINNPSPAAPTSRNLELNYHGRWALGATPFVLAMFAMIVATARKSGRTMALVIGFLLITGFYAMMFAAKNLGLGGTISPFVAAWMPNAVVLLLSAAVMSLRLQRRKRGGADHLSRYSLRARAE